jgi:hypothetical protein
MECAQKRYSFTQSAKLQSPMKKISDLFTDEEKKQLSYLGSMLHQEPMEEEQGSRGSWTLWTAQRRQN